MIEEPCDFTQSEFHERIPADVCGTKVLETRHLSCHTRVIIALL